MTTQIKAKIYLLTIILYSITMSVIFSTIERFNGLGWFTFSLFFIFLALSYIIWKDRRKYIGKIGLDAPFIKSTKKSYLIHFFLALFLIIFLNQSIIKNSLQLLKINFNKPFSSSTLTTGKIKRKVFIFHGTKYTTRLVYLSINSIPLQCNFIKDKNYCQRFEKYDNQLAQVRYLEKYENFELSKPLILEFKVGKHFYSQDDMINYYKEQQMSIWLFIILVLLMSILFYFLTIYNLERAFPIKIEKEDN